MTRDHPNYHPCLHLLAVERTGWRRWVFGRWVYPSEQFRIDVQRKLKAYEHMCSQCKFWSSVDGIEGFCKDSDASYNSYGKLPTDGWRCTDITSGLTTGAEFGCIRFQPKMEEFNDQQD